MITRDFVCRVSRTDWLTPTVLSIVFEPSIRFAYEPGQFITLLVPQLQGREPERRCYTLTVSHEEALSRGYQILVKMTGDDVTGTEFLKRLRAGDTILASGPFGNFHFRTLTQNRQVCFVTTGTGISPVRAIVGSYQFEVTKPEKVLLVNGVRSEQELLFSGFFEARGVKTVACMTRPSNLTQGLWGRVTDFLNRDSEAIDWRNTDFYVIGNERMVQEVLYLLKFKKGVPMQNIFTENFRNQENVVPFRFREQTVSAEWEWDLRKKVA